MKSRTAAAGRKPATLWSQSVPVDELMFAYTVGNDREWDARLLRWDVIGSLGHVEGLRASGLIGRADHGRLRAGLRAAVRAVDAGRLRIGAEHEDAHSAVEAWLTRRLGAAGERVHTARSRNDQVACDLRLLLKAELLDLHRLALDVAGELTAFAARHRGTVWPGYTHTRRAMPSSAGLWAAALAEGLVDSAESLAGVWARVDRSPLGSAAGYGVPLPLDRRATARALGFAGLDLHVTSVQNGRGKLEAAVLAWCVDVAHDLSRWATDVVLLSGEEFGLLELPPSLATGSSIMPHKRNPDLFELTRARAAALEGDLTQVLAIKGKLTSGYHRDFQLLKEPLIRGLERSREMLVIARHVVGRIGVNRARARAALTGDLLATDEVMRRVRAGTPFRRAYREVAALVKSGAAFPPATGASLLRSRRSVGGAGALELGALRARIRGAGRWNASREARFARAIKRLVGRGA